MAREREMMNVEKRDRKRQRDEMLESYVYFCTYALEDRKRVMSQAC